MIIHSYFTDGFYPWAKLFLESFRHHNGDSIPIKLDAININKDQMKELYSVCNNLHIFEHIMDLEKVAAEHNIVYSNLLKQKKEIETLHITHRSKSWKLLIAGDLRVKAICSMLDKFPNDSILHFDIDTYIRADLNDLVSLVNNNDICVRFRLHKSAENRKVLISTMGYKNNKNSREFIKSWIDVIESIELKDRPIGWGQTSYYRAYLKCKDKYKWGDVPPEFAAARQLPTDKAWGGNTSAGKTVNVKKYRKDFNKVKRKKLWD